MRRRLDLSDQIGVRCELGTLRGIVGEIPCLNVGIVAPMTPTQAHRALSSCDRCSSRSTTRCSARYFRGELGPGEKISPPDIAASLGVSVTPVRDAVNLLAAEGLVHVRLRRGTIVAPMSADDVAELDKIA